MKGDQGTAWIPAKVDTSVGVYHKIFFQAIDHSNQGSYTGDIALDDLEYLDHNCKYVPPPTDPPTIPSVTVTPLPWDCTFEGGTTCTWTQGTNDDFDWTIQNGSTPTIGTGPSADHTTQTPYGKYALIDAMSGNEEDVARLYSDDLPIGTQMCLTFWYHMYGAHVGSLNVGYGNTDGNEEGTVIWTKSGTQGYDWILGRVAIIARETNPKVYIEGVAAAGYQGDIAIDDIIMVYGSCPALCQFDP
nr:MAM and LDL-receptor class A domain-containing protein 1-like [Lytechinus pictus]